ncbi:hypothetical protein AVEN_84966-1 [Araneus ventricosus]|uniref:Uncharacterized protein n=1 Tax=Araneus ventricosus TaxID=182803 RepID=A0A4Y2BYW8_ARAVE|nr:hypothetical protein AVEN_84966-1 [Araneus ventricosus]
MEFQPAFHSQKVSQRNNFYSSHSRVGKLSGIMERLADRFTALYRKYLINSCTGPENASNSPLAMGPSPATSRDSVCTLDYCGCGEIENLLHHAARCPLTLSYHHKEPSPQFIVSGGF